MSPLSLFSDSFGERDDLDEVGFPDEFALPLLSDEDSDIRFKRIMESLDSISERKDSKACESFFGLSKIKMSY